MNADHDPLEAELAGMRPAQYASIPLAESVGMDARLGYVIMGWPVIDPPGRYRLGQERGNEELARRARCSMLRMFRNRVEIARRIITSLV